MRITYVVEGRPRAWQRAGRRGTRTYKPSELREYQRIVAYAAMAAVADRAQGWPVDAEYRVTVEGHMPSLASLPDVDNLAKCHMDALQRVLYRDDSQVSELVVRRMVDRERPRAVVTVEVVG